MRGVVVVLVAVLAGACAAGPPRVVYVPDPADVLLREEGRPDVLRAWIGLRGFESRERDGREEWGLRARVRVENRSDAELTWIADELLLLTRDLQAFASGEVQPLVPIAPGAAERFEVWFAMPERWREGGGEPDLRSLSLSWGLRSENAEYRLTTSFARAHPPFGTVW